MESTELVGCWVFSHGQSQSIRRDRTVLIFVPDAITEKLPRAKPSHFRAIRIEVSCESGRRPVSDSDVSFRV